MITLTHYDKGVHEEKLQRLVEVKKYLKKGGVTWVHIDKLTPAIANDLASHFKFHPLIMEDLLHHQRPKMEVLEDLVFICLKMLTSKSKSRANEVIISQCSILFGKNYLVSIEDKPTKLFQNVRERLKKGRFAKTGPDFLAYALLDTIVDGYYEVLEVEGEDIERLEKDLLHSPDEKTLNRLHHEKREMLLIRRAIWPLREIINGLSWEKHTLIKADTLIHLRDVYDHIVESIDTVETYREMLSGMLDIYLSTMSNKLNEVMKVLTVIATIFIPLTFITGIYGMNFEFMPELTTVWGYPAIWTIMILLFLGMIVYFKRKKWV